MINLLHPFTLQSALILIKIIALLVAIAYYTLSERKLMASIQRRRGPNTVGLWGLLQPLADGLKLIAKEILIPSRSNTRIFVIAPIVILTLSLLGWSTIPFNLADILETPIKITESCASVLSETTEVCIQTPPALLEIKLPTIARSLDYIGTGAVSAVIVYAASRAVYKRIQEREITFTIPANKGGRKRKRSNGRNPLPCLFIPTVPDTLNIITSENSIYLVSELNQTSDLHYNLLLILALSSLTVYGLIIAGWASNSKYAFLGALRSAAQMISYEVAINLVILPVISMGGSLNFVELVHAQERAGWFVLPLLPISIIFFISMIAETNRTPFDLPEAEAELVAGYNVEYSSIIFAMFFLAEYSNMILMSLLKTLLFFGGWSVSYTFILPALVFSMKGLVFCFLFVLVRATFPRYRYDQLMDIGWKIFLPLSTGFLIYIIGVLFAIDGLPVVQELNPSPYAELTYTFLPFFLKLKEWQFYIRREAGT